MFHALTVSLKNTFLFKSGMARSASLALAAVPASSTTATAQIIGFTNFIVFPIGVEGPIRLAGVQSLPGSQRGACGRERCPPPWGSAGRDHASTILLKGKAAKV